MPTILREAGINLRCHHEEGFIHNTPDDVWIRAVAMKGYIIVTSDKGIETDPLNKMAVIDAKAKVFILDEQNSRAVHWAAAIIVSKERIYQAVRDNEGPFFMSVVKKGSLIYRFRTPTLEEITNNAARKTQS